ncbi:MAG: fused MFS/spermidine synthase [Dehalococcoidales bacterium]|nr:fused MFS/spermidine synthase [Dehalococcoidales bacterium]
MRRSSTLWKAYTISFIRSFRVMVIELIASRILAPCISTSLHTWTSIIGIIPAVITPGNYAGGRIAERFTSPCCWWAFSTSAGWRPPSSCPRLITGHFHDEGNLESYLTARNPILLSDSHAPTDILVASFPG